MVFIRDFSIQDIVRNINRRIILFDIVTLLLLFLLLLVFLIVVKNRNNKENKPITFLYKQEEIKSSQSSPSLIFGSKGGETYTYTWCQGASRTKVSNRVYFSNENEAIQSGRRLSKLCK
ncbi:MAG: hypothetical protein RI935_97 [Candidatus Parcubacteria bacterium]|jgi:hypothetical protein